MNLLSMNLLRRLVVVLLMISLPAYGWASVDMPACKMMQQAVTEGPQIRHDTGAMNDAHCAAHQAQKQQQSAKDRVQHGCDGSHCSCGAVYQAAQSFVTVTVATSHSVIQTPTFSSITVVAASLWRPPTLG